MAAIAYFILQNLPTAPLALIFPLIIVGLLLAFFGKVIFYYLIFVLGGVFLGVGLALLMFLAGKESSYILLGGVGGFLGGGVIAVLLFRLQLFLVGAVMGGLVGFVLFPDMNPPYAIGILSAVGGILFIIMFDKLLAVASAILGGGIIGVCALFSGTGVTIAGVITLFVIAAGSFFQLFGPVKSIKPLEKLNIKKLLKSIQGENPERESEGSSFKTEVLRGRFNFTGDRGLNGIANQVGNIQWIGPSIRVFILPLGSTARAVCYGLSWQAQNLIIRSFPGADVQKLLVHEDAQIGFNYDLIENEPSKIVEALKEVSRIMGTLHYRN